MNGDTIKILQKFIIACLVGAPIVVIIMDVRHLAKSGKFLLGNRRDWVRPQERKFYFALWVTYRLAVVLFLIYLLTRIPGAEVS